MDESLKQNLLLPVKDPENSSSIHGTGPGELMQIISNKCRSPASLFFILQFVFGMLHGSGRAAVFWRTSTSVYYSGHTTSKKEREAWGRSYSITNME